MLCYTVLFFDFFSIFMKFWNKIIKDPISVIFYLRVRGFWTKQELVYDISIGQMKNFLQFCDLIKSEWKVSQVMLLTRSMF